MFKLQDKEELTHNPRYYRNRKSEAQRLGISTNKFVKLSAVFKKHEAKRGVK